MLQAALTKRPYREGDKGGLLLAVAAAVKQPVVRLLLKEPEEKEILTVKDVGPDVHRRGGSGSWEGAFRGVPCKGSFIALSRYHRTLSLHLCRVVLDCVFGFSL